MVLDKEKHKQKVYIGTKLDPETRHKLLAFIKERKHYFAWDIYDMSEIYPDIITHKLNVDPKFKPIKQKRKKFSLTGWPMLWW